MLSRDQWLGLGFVLFAIVLVFLWVPLDVETGYVEKVRRKLSIGDSLAPTLAGVFLFLGGAALLALGGAKDGPTLDLGAIGFAISLIGLYFIGFLIMWGTGPIVVAITNAVTGDALEYRLLRDTVPWKYLGFVAGGTFAIASTVSLLEGRFTWRAVLTGLGAVAALILVYDIPFEDLLLPPNGDV